MEDEVKIIVQCFERRKHSVVGDQHSVVATCAPLAQMVDVQFWEKKQGLWLDMWESIYGGYTKLLIKITSTVFSTDVYIFFYINNNNIFFFHAS